LKSKNYSSLDQVPEAIQSYALNGLASNIKRFCTEAILKEAFVEAFSSKKLVRFVMEKTPWKEGGYWKTTNTDGVLTISSNPSNFPSNADYCGM